MGLGIDKKVAELLMKKDLKNQGLMQGTMGLSIFFYHLAEKLSDDRYFENADSLVDDIFKNLTPVPAFWDGITGIGWGIEYLIQNGLCEGDADETLEEADTKIFKILNEGREIPFGLSTGLVGYLQYFIMRLKNKANSPNDTTKINIEVLKRLIHRIDQVAPSHFQNLTRDVKFNLLDDFYMMLWSCASAFELNIYNDKIFNMLKQWESNLTAHLPYMHFNRLYLAAALYRINQIVGTKKMENQIKTLLFSVDVDQLKSEVDLKNIKSIRFGYLGQLLVLSKCTEFFDSTYPNYSLLNSVKSEIIDLCNNKLMDELDKAAETTVVNVNSEYGLVDGWAGAGLMYLLHPEIFADS